MKLSNLCKSKKNVKGFTLIELIIVIAIVTILAAIFIPALSNYLKEGQYKECRGKRELLIAEYAISLNTEYEFYLQEKEINDAITFTYSLTDYLATLDTEAKSCPHHKELYEISGDYFVCPNDEHKDTDHIVIPKPTT